MKYILIVDDDEAILDALSTVMEMSGYRVRTITKGEQVWNILSEGLPDIILLDILLSGSDGRDIARNLKGSRSTKDIPILMFSAHPNVKESALESGADDFIAKPFELSDMLKMVDEYCCKRSVLN